MSVSNELKLKLQALESSLAEAGACAVAVSGGLDSRLLAAIALRVNADVLCVHFTGPHMAEQETEWAVEWLAGMDAKYTVLSIDPLVHPAVAMNRYDRCYHCKRALFSALAAHVPGRTLMDGSNATDHTAYRPGLKALAELRVQSPLAENTISKPEIHLLATHMELAAPRQPATPCLLTRLPYDTRVRSGQLDLIASLESRHRSLGFTHFRVRLVDGSPILFASPRHRHLCASIPVEWTDDLSGYWDKQST